MKPMTIVIPSYNNRQWGYLHDPSKRCTRCNGLQTVALRPANKGSFRGKTRLAAIRCKRSDINFRLWF